MEQRPRRDYHRRMKRLSTWLGLVGALAVAACGEEATQIIDAPSDGRMLDGGGDEPDAAEPDASAIDAPTDGPVDSIPDCGCVPDAPDVTPDAPAIDAPAIDGPAPDVPVTPVDAPVTPVDAPVTPPDAPDVTPDAPDVTPDAPPFAAGCADGTREGFLDPVAFPSLAACAGTWTGDVANAAPLCAPGWHLCRGPEQPLASITYADAVAFPGCFAFDAAQDNWMCFPGCSDAVAAGIDIATRVDLGGAGAGCPYLIPGAPACFAGGRIDVSENDGSGCNFRDGITTGAVCCQSIATD